MKPALAKFGLDWATFQVLRRTNGTLSPKLKVDAKVAADQRGYGIGVSLVVYTDSDRPRKKQAVKKIDSEVSRKQWLKAVSGKVLPERLPLSTFRRFGDLKGVNGV
jgi:hypothetical protein